MSRLTKRIDKTTIEKTAKRCKERGVRIPTFAELRDPNLIDESIKKRLPQTGLSDVDPLNLFRITWKNQISTGLYGPVNFFELPSALTGVRARIVGLIGKYFPTGAHKVGAAFGCLVPRLVSGEFDPTLHKAVWPSTGNFCRGGAFDCALLDCTAIAILPEEMSKERFTWLTHIGAEVIPTPGCESNVKEIYDKCWELKKDPNNVIFNQFEEFGNPIFHYAVTGPALAEVFTEIKSDNSRFAAFVSATGLAGTIAAGDYLKNHSGLERIVASEALQCPTLFMNGFGGHRIEGIGDKHVPWVHNIRNTDVVTAIDDEACMRLVRLFNTKAGHDFLSAESVPQETIAKLPLLGISSVSNMLSAIKTAKYFELDEDDIIFTVFTDSMELYASRLTEIDKAHGAYSNVEAARDFERYLFGQSVDYIKELGYYDRKALHNLKYFTWVEQQGRDIDDLKKLWCRSFWQELFEKEPAHFDEQIREFNKLIDNL